MVKIARQLRLLCLALLPLVPGSLQAGGDVGSLIKKGDVHDRNQQPAEALKFYLPAEKLAPADVPLLLRIARQYRHLAAQKDSVAEKIRLSEIGRDYAVRSVALAPQDAEAWLSVAISNAKMLPLLGSGEKVEALRKVKTTVDKSLSLDAGLDLAWYVLGCWHQRLAEVGALKRATAKLLYGGLPDGSSETAVKCFQKAIKLNPNRLSSYIELGLVYAFQGKNTEAREFLKKGLAMPDEDFDDPECKQRAREALMNLE